MSAVPVAADVVNQISADLKFCCYVDFLRCLEGLKEPHDVRVLAESQDTSLVVVLRLFALLQALLVDHLDGCHLSAHFVCRQLHSANRRTAELAFVESVLLDLVVESLRCQQLVNPGLLVLRRLEVQLPPAVALGETEFDRIEVPLCLFAFLHGTVHHVDIVQFVAPAGLAPATPALSHRGSNLVKVELAVLECKLELSEFVGPCLEVAGSGVVEASLKVRV